MDITTFIVNKDGKQMQYPLQLNNTINDFKEMIKKEYDSYNKYKSNTISVG